MKIYKPTKGKGKKLLFTKNKKENSDEEGFEPPVSKRNVSFQN